jgi:DNA repair protein RadA/Sms
MRSSFFSEEAEAVDIREVDTQPDDRLIVGAGFDQLLGGGLPFYAASMVTGTPGSGKTTWCVQAAARVARDGRVALYNCGEESPMAVKAVADRVAPGARFLVCSYRTPERLVDESIRKSAALVVQDSLQSLDSGRRSQGENAVESMRAIKRLVNSTGCAALVVGHSTKAGVYSGPATIKHDVDLHLHFVLTEDGDRRFVVSKNRRGPTCEVPIDVGASGVRIADGSSLAEVEGKDVVLLAAEALLDGASEEEAMLICWHDRARFNEARAMFERVMEMER